MPRYVVERNFENGLHIPLTEAGATVCLGVVERNSLPVDRITRVTVLDPYFYR